MQNNGTVAALSLLGQRLLLPLLIPSHRVEPVAPVALLSVVANFRTQCRYRMKTQSVKDTIGSYTFLKQVLRNLKHGILSRLL